MQITDRQWIPMLKDIYMARRRIGYLINETPIMTSRTLSDMVKADIFFKCENLQKVDSFKLRGAVNAVMSIPGDRAGLGVATHSSGNHAQALSLAAQYRGIPAYIVIPGNALRVKLDAVKGYGAEIILCKPTLESRESTLEKVIDRTGTEFIHPYDDGKIISGSASAALEMMEEVKDLDIIMAPVDGGGLISGTSLTVRYLSPETRVSGEQPENADDALKSFRNSELIPSIDPVTIADGLRNSLSK